MPQTINIRVDSLKGTYYDEKGIADYLKAKDLFKKLKNQTRVAENMGIHVAQVNRYLKPDYTPHKSTAVYFSDFKRNKEWFYGL